MGSHDGTGEPACFCPNGLLPNEAASVTRQLHPRRWAKAEEHTAKLIACIQPNWPAEKHRNAVASYVQRLVSECMMCQVFTFGSVPLKTYLPDGDIDLTAFSINSSLKDTWYDMVRVMLEREEMNEDAEFRVKEVQVIAAEVKIVKCLVDNIVVDISFNQLGGLCTLCFLEEVDSMISPDHLFKRSIILIKAWCYYESRILGAHHGLISTYALETLVLYIFYVFNRSFAGPLEVLYRFLEFFSKYDWDNFCVSLWGPVPQRSLPDMTAEPPRKDGGDMVLNQMLLDALSSAYAVIPGGNENREQPFPLKKFNIVDPLRTNNNLGRSVSQGNFYRIRSAFSFGAQRLSRLLECPEVNLVAELNQFFTNTWERHGKGPRPDASVRDEPESRIEDSDHVDSLQNHEGGVKGLENPSGHDLRIEQMLNSQISRVQHSDDPVRSIKKTLNASDADRAHFQKADTKSVTLKSSEQGQQNSPRVTADHDFQNEKGRNRRTSVLQNEVPVTHQFARTYSSPELRNTSSEVMSRGRRNMVAERTKGDSTKSGYTKENRGAGAIDNHTRNLPTDDVPKGLTNAGDSNCSTDGDESVSVAHQMHMRQEGKDLMNVSSSSTHNFAGQVQMPMNYASQLPVPIAASFLEYAYHNSLSRMHSDLPSYVSQWDSHMHHPHVSFPLPVSQSFSGSITPLDQDEMNVIFSGDSASSKANQQEGDYGGWTDSDSVKELVPEEGRFQDQDIERKQQCTSVASTFASSSQTSMFDHRGRKSQHGRTKEKRESHKSKYADYSAHKNDRASGTSSPSTSRFSSPSGAASRTKGSSESSWDGSPPKYVTTTKARFGRKTPPAVDPLPVDDDGWPYEPVNHESSEAEDSSNKISLPHAETIDPSVSSSLAEIHRLPGGGAAPLSYFPIAQMPINAGSQHRMLFYPAGPPVPFVTYVPFYNMPSEPGVPTDSTSREVGEEFASLPVDDSDQIEAPNRILNQPGVSSDAYSTVNESSTLEHSPDRKSDILTSDLASHRQHLQYGRLCQNSQSQGPLFYPPPVAVPPGYLQGQYQVESPGRPVPVNAELCNHLMNLDPRLLPVAPHQPGPSRPAGVYQQYGGELPRSRAGTGTYLPNPKVFKDRNVSNSRHHRGNYNYERKEHNGEREGNWNANSRGRHSGRGQPRYQYEKATTRMERPYGRNSQFDRQWDQMRQNPYVPYHSTGGPSSGPRSGRYGSGDAEYAMYQVPSRNDEGASPSGNAPPFVMLYPYDQAMGYGMMGQQVRFGSVESHPFSRDEATEVYEYPRGSVQSPRYEEDSARSSPDQPCSSSFMRGA